MSFKKTLVVAAVLLGMNNQAMAADGEVKFTGTVVSAPCNISPGSARQTVDFGALNVKFLSDGLTVRKGFEIELQNCSFPAPGGAGVAFVNRKVAVTFTGVQVAAAPTELKTSGGSQGSVAVQIEGPTGAAVTFGQAIPEVPLKPGENKIQFVAIAKEANGETATEGTFEATTNFSLAYN